MKRQKLMIASVILAVSILSSASCLAAGNDKSSQKAADDAAYVMMSLFGNKGSPVPPIGSGHIDMPTVRTATQAAQAMQDDQLKQANDRMKDQGIKAWDAFKKWKDEHPMDSDQDEKATQKFIDTLSGSNKGADGAKAAANQSIADIARDAAKDAMRDARQSSIDAARQTGSDAAQGMDKCKPMGH
jgi:hypothetical protein